MTRVADHLQHFIQNPQFVSDENHFQLSFDQDGKLEKFSYPRSYAENDLWLATFEVLGDWIVRKQRSLGQISARELESYLRYENHQEVFDSESLSKLSSFLLEMMGIAIQGLEQNHFTGFSSLKLVEKIQSTVDFLNAMHKSLFSDTVAPILVDIEGDTVYLEKNGSLLSENLVKLSEKEVLSLSFVAERDNQS